MSDYLQHSTINIHEYNSHLKDKRHARKAGIQIFI